MVIEYLLLLRQDAELCVNCSLGMKAAPTRPLLLSAHSAWQRVKEQVAVTYRRPEGSEWTMCSMPDTENTSFIFPILEMRWAGPEFFAQVHSGQ